MAVALDGRTALNDSALCQCTAVNICMDALFKFDSVAQRLQVLNKTR